MRATTVETAAGEDTGADALRSPEHAAFVEAQDRLLRHYGVEGRSRFARLARPTAEARKKQYRSMFHVDPATLPEAYFDMQVAGMRIPGALPTWAVLLRRVAGLRGLRPEVTFADELGRLEVPTLVVWGEHDMAPAEAGREAIARTPRGRFEYLPGVGHFPFLEVPDETARLVREFVGEL
jgi:pimeloyl-ACP methyl ester carboxylesterase